MEAFQFILILIALSPLSLLIILVFGWPIYGPILIRTYRMKKLAEKFGFDFNSNRQYLPALSSPDRETRNHMKGRLNNQEIEIYDVFYRNGLSVSDGVKSGSFGRRGTLVKIDGKTLILKAGLVGYSPVCVIDQSLQSVKNGEYLEKGTINVSKNDKPPITWLFVGLFIILGLIIWLFSRSV